MFIFEFHNKEYFGQSNMHLLLKINLNMFVSRHSQIDSVDFRYEITQKLYFKQTKLSVIKIHHVTVVQVMDYYDMELDLHVHMAILLLPIMLSCWIRNLKYLVPVSLFANAAMTVGIAVTLYYVTRDIPAPSTRDYVAPWTKIPLFFGTAIYSFEGIGLVCKTKPRRYGKVQ